jgi:hypothetical protein
MRIALVMGFSKIQQLPDNNTFGIIRLRLSDVQTAVSDFNFCHRFCIRQYVGFGGIAN